MRTRDLSEIIGRRDALAVSRALTADWKLRGRDERPEASSLAHTESRRREQLRLTRLGVRYATV